MQESPELVTDADGRPDPDKFAAALTVVRGQAGTAWVTDPDGRRIAALVPAEVAEALSAAPRGLRHRQAESAQS